MNISYKTAESVCAGHPDKLCDLIADAIPSNGKSFGLWAVPGVFCFGQPTIKGSPAGRPYCAEIPETGKVYYVGSLVWTVRKSAAGPIVEPELKENGESIAVSQRLKGLVVNSAQVVSDMDAAKVASKYTKL